MYSPRWTAVLAVALVVTAGTLGQPAQAAATPARPVPVIYDSDLDFDDASTLAYLCEEHKLRRIELRAVTVTNDGFGRPERTLLGDAALPPYPSPVSAPELIARTVRRSAEPVTLLATGPLTNVAAALGRPGVAGRLGRIQLMGGAIAVPGNLYGSALPGYDNSQEFNMWMDPVSARAVLHRARPGSIRLVPLDATAAVPITQEYVARLAADQHAPGARLTYRIVSRPDLMALINLGIMYWWDALAAVSAVHGDEVTTFRRIRIDVVQTGVQSGRTVVTPSGRPVHAAFDAEREAFEQRFLDSLNGRLSAPPR